MEKLAPVMFAGTGSDVGKSLLAAGLCRIFLQDGYTPAPFKAQNMALNSYVTSDGLEIGRAQATQAEAAGLECSADMNPVLLKPSGDMTSQVIINGKVAGNKEAREYFRKEGMTRLKEIAHRAYDRLEARYNPIVLEGAGSISELNLHSVDFVNLSMAEYAGAKVILVADIDRGGVFASVYGSIMLQSPEQRKLIKGIIINKFRGDLTLFDEGRKMMEDLCGIPVLGIVPMAKHIHIDEEDSLPLEKKFSKNAQGKIKVAVVLLRHMSNFTDFNILERHPEVNLYYASNPDDLTDADIIILPGSKNTLSDLLYLRKSGMAKGICDSKRNGKTVIGICGGYQMMGETVADPEGVESDIVELPGLGLLPIKTVLTNEKTTRQVKFRFMDDERECYGYEIHMGRTQSQSPFIIMEDGHKEGCMTDQTCFGSYIHGILDNAPVIEYIMKPFLNDEKAGCFDFHAYKEKQYDLLAEWIRKHVDIDKLYKILKNYD